MRLNYLDFDYNEDELGAGCWDALASVDSSRLPELLEEAQQLLLWAESAFAGRRAPLEDGGDWDWEISAQTDAGQPLAAVYDEAATRLTLCPWPTERTTLGITLSASAAFSEALRAHFGLD